MNPYDFVPLDTDNAPTRKKPVWHNALAANTQHPDKLYSGYLNLYIKAETPLFIPSTDASQQKSHARSPMQNPDKAAEHIYRKDGMYIIPGTSLKGVLRTVVETLCSGCLGVFHEPREYMHNSLPPAFASCQNNTALCIACRLFGMMPTNQRNAGVFLGKVNVGDALVYEDSIRYHEPIYTAVLDSPKPRHTAFYLDPQKRYIAGRKFYFHHARELRVEKRLIEIRRKPGEYRNQHIEPLYQGTEFSARLDFTNLEADEFAALLLSIALHPDMRHKIGYGKPIGLGTVRIDATELLLVNYSERYTNFRAGRGMIKYDLDQMTHLMNEQMASFEDPQIRTHWQHFSSQVSLQNLHRIWQWPPDTSVDYVYPSQSWFKEHPQARIQDTKNAYTDYRS